MPFLPARFKTSHAVQRKFLSRARKFSPETFFLSVLHLAASTNREGYFTALHRTWTKCGLKLESTPAKSSLSAFRDKVSSDFFKEIFEEDLLLHDSNRKDFRGHYIYAIDGDHLDLPASQSVMEEGYRGFPFSSLEETHYPKMYTVHAMDLLNGLIAKFSCSNEVSEVQQARAMVSSLEKTSITIYDRLHQTFDTALAHERAGNYFFVRVKDQNPKLTSSVRDFCKSNRRSGWIDIEAPGPRRKSEPGLRLRLIKVKNKKTKKEMVFMTNAPEGLIRDREAGDFYQRRWGIESSFKDLTDTLKMGQWHTTKLNGVMQEIYALLWLVNNVRRVTSIVTRSSGSWLKAKYRKLNFKLIITVLVDQFELVIRGRIRKLRKLIDHLLYRDVENREHLSRSYKRQVKKLGRQYLNASKVPRRTAP